MPFALESNRRGFMKMLEASPLLAQIAAHRFMKNPPQQSDLTRGGTSTAAWASRR